MLLKNDIRNIKKIVKENNILLSEEERFCYSEDSTNISRSSSLPDAVIFAETIEQVQDVLKYANKHKIPVICRGAGTNMVGACTCPKGGIVLSFAKMNKILDFNPIDMTMKVQPGVVLNDIKILARSKGLFYPPDPSNYKVSTIGGSIAQSSGGAMGFKYGTTKDYILSLTVVMPDGTLMTFGKNTVKEAVGYHLNQLIVGSEGTLAVVVEAVLKLIPKPESERSVLAYFDTLDDAVAAVHQIYSSNIFPATIDFMDNNSVVTVEKFYPCGLRTDKDALLLINLDGFEISMNYQVSKIKSILESSNSSGIYVAETEQEIEEIWTERRSSFAATAKLAPDVLSDDIIVPRSKIVQMVKGCREICENYHLQMCMVGHLGDGNIHPQVALNLENESEFKNYFKAKSEMYNLAISLGGTISSEHGVGIEKIEYLHRTMSDESIKFMKRLKSEFDPNNILNPDKIFR